MPMRPRLPVSTLHCPVDSGLSGPCYVNLQEYVERWPFGLCLRGLELLFLPAVGVQCLLRAI